jgi:hypothetical protein
MLFCSLAICLCSPPNYSLFRNVKFDITRIFQTFLLVAFLNKQLWCVYAERVNFSVFSLSRDFCVIADKYFLAIYKQGNNQDRFLTRK